MSNITIATQEDEYEAFLAEKLRTAVAAGFDAVALHDRFFPFQAWIVRRALKLGKSAIFADCGLGKTFMQLVWARLVADHTSGKVLILAPLAVTWQTVAEAEKWGISRDRITVTNYEQLPNLDPSTFVGVVLDESSILKNFDGATKKAIVDAFAQTPYKLACTATPSPNDPEELGNHAEFLNVMTRSEMLAMYFVHDAGDTGEWRIKGHAVKHFWQFVSSWAVMLRKPSDIGFDDAGYELPPLNLIEHKIHTPSKGNGALFNDLAVSATDFNAELRRTQKERLEKTKEITDSLNGNVLIWIKQNEEGDVLSELMPNAIEVRGDDSSQTKVDAIKWFSGASSWKPTKKNAKSTIRSGTERTKTKLLNTEKEQRNEEINSEEIDTSRIQSSEQSVLRNRSREETKIQNSITNLISKESMVFRSRITNPYSNRRGVFVRSVVRKIGILTTKTSSMLTTPMKQEWLEGYSAEIATMVSESSKTTLNYSKEPSNISEKKILVSKAKIFGYGINFQNSHEMIFASLDFSFESLYQGIRRQWRFGQKNPVNVHIITTDTMTNVIEAIREKQRKFEEMQKEMSEAMNASLKHELVESAVYDTDEVKTDWYHIRRGDCTRLIRDIPSESVGLTFFSPPFASLFTFSDSVEDMSNCRNGDDFFNHFKFLVPELMRITKPGRLCGLHVTQLTTGKARDGYLSIVDFRGDMIRLFQSFGWHFHFEVTVWKDPQLAAIRTKNVQLLHRTTKRDCCDVRPGLADYILLFKKPGQNAEPVNFNGEGLPFEYWTEVASPVWMSISESDTLQYRSARSEKDERHLTPTQLEVIRRVIMLYSNPGDTVYSPFGGIGSEPCTAVEMGRVGIAHELKESYYGQMKGNLAAVLKAKGQGEGSRRTLLTSPINKTACIPSSPVLD